MEAKTKRKVRVQVWLSGENGPIVSLDSVLPFDSEPQTGDVITLGDFGFEVTHKEFEREGRRFVSYIVCRHDAGVAQDATKISEIIGRELGIPES